MIEYTRKQEGRYTSISIHDELSILLNIIGKLRGVNGHPAHKIHGMFFRSGDLESSYHYVSKAFTSEAGLALDYIGKKYELAKFPKDATNRQIKLYTHHTGTGWNQNDGMRLFFESRDLSPSLRHFINDYCRVLEPLVELMANGLPEIDVYDRSKKHFVSFNTFLRRALRINVSLPFDAGFFEYFYSELWNDYKHNSSPGPKTTGWAVGYSELISTPLIVSNANDYFKDMKVEQFLDKSLKELDLVLDYLQFKMLTQQP